MSPPSIERDRIGPSTPLLKWGCRRPNLSLVMRCVHIPTASNGHCSRLSNGNTLTAVYPEKRGACVACRRVFCCVLASNKRTEHQRYKGLQSQADRRAPSPSLPATGTPRAVKSLALQKRGSICTATKRRPAATAEARARLGRPKVKP